MVDSNDAMISLDSIFHHHLPHHVPPFFFLIARKKSADFPASNIPRMPVEAAVSLWRHHPMLLESDAYLMHISSSKLGMHIGRKVVCSGSTLWTSSFSNWISLKPKKNHYWSSKPADVFWIYRNIYRSLIDITIIYIGYFPIESIQSDRRSRYAVRRTWNGPGQVAAENLSSRQHGPMRNHQWNMKDHQDFDQYCKSWILMDFACVYIILYYIRLYYIILYHIILYYIILYLSYHIISYYIILNYIKSN